MPDVYYDMLPKDFEALIIGYNRRRNNDSAELRRATYINILPHVQKLPFSQFCRDFWPLETENVETKKLIISQEDSAKVFEQITQAHKKRLSDGRSSRAGHTNRG